MCDVREFSLLLVLAISGCSAEDSAWTAFPIPEQAVEVRETGNEASMKITSFVVKAEFPDTTILDFYRERLAPPWVLCEGRTKWDSYSDKFGPDPFFVHSLRKSWANIEASRLLMIRLSYESDGEQFREMPDNDNQIVELFELVDEDLALKFPTGKIRCPST